MSFDSTTEQADALFEECTCGADSQKLWNNAFGGEGDGQTLKVWNKSDKEGELSPTGDKIAGPHPPTQDPFNILRANNEAARALFHQLKQAQERNMGRLKARTWQQ